MSIKNLFGKSFKNYESASVDVESADFVDSVIKDKETYLPPIDFATASNFVKYGSAKLYYENSIERIYEDYPYDGSKKEQIEFQLSSSYLDRWMYKEKYPKTTGYINLGTTSDLITRVDKYATTGTPEFIRVWGGLHTASAGMEGKPIRQTFSDSVKYDLELNRTTNWRLNIPDGASVEFWLKKDAFTAEREVILDLWNGEASSSADYGRLTIELTGAAPVFVATLQSGSQGFYRQKLATMSVVPSSLTEWHHYAMSFSSASSGVTTSFYIDGRENLTQTIGTPVNEIEGLINGYLGALQTSPSGSLAPANSGKLLASIDEFRFWKTKRTARQIELSWFKDVGGGTNTDDNNTNLGVYFKFNEGILNNLTDQTILDYSGRIANGYWQGYSSTARTTGSAFSESSYNLVETPDPIIYSNHPDVRALYTEMSVSGSDYDGEYGGSFYESMPNWMTMEDGETQENLKKLTQILSSYFDTLHAQITALPNLKNKVYVEDEYKPIPFADRLLENKGFITKDILINPEIYERFDNFSIDPSPIQFEEQISDIKNLIYTNIYNNLEAIYKSKGTEKSIRNFLRCFGIDDEIVKLNVYTDGGEHYFDDTYKATSFKKKYINFHEKDYLSSTIHQTSSANNSLTYIYGPGTGSSTLGNFAFTLEADVYVPYKKEPSEVGFYNTSFLSSSVYGFHQAITSSNSDFTWVTNEIANLQVYLVRDSLNSKRAKWVLKNTDGSINVSTDFVEDIYNNNRWNIALRIKPQTYPYAGNVTNTSPDYTLNFYAVNHNISTVQYEFDIDTTINFNSGSSYINDAKRVYAGAHLQNFTGSVLNQSDVQIGSVRGWLDYLSNDSIKNHNLDPSNYGQSRSFRPSSAFLDDQIITSKELNIFNWDFSTVTSSDSSGNFIVEDLSSGSTDVLYSADIDATIRRENRGLGLGFGSSATSFIENEFLYAQKKELPEISYTNDNVFIKGDYEKFFVVDDEVGDNFYLLEKSMNQVVSEEMLKMFSKTQEMANLIGHPVDRYRLNYKKLDKVRELFFDNVNNTPSLENFMNYYKWIDESISKMIMQLIPASVNFGPSIIDVVESHILERNKLPRRIGLLDTVESTEGVLKGSAELHYNWRTGHAPINQVLENTNCLWQKERKERLDISDRERIRQAIINDGVDDQLVNKTKIRSKSDRTTYDGSTYALKRLSRPFRLNASFGTKIHGGINYNQQKDRDFYKTNISVHGPIAASGAPRNIIGIGIGEGDGITEKQVCDDSVNPNNKSYYDATVQVGRFTADTSGFVPHDDSASYSFKLKSSIYWPFNIKSGSVSGGYADFVATNFRSNAIITNLHSDTVDITNEIPIQGPFTEAHVGGHQGRHVRLNRFDDSLVTEGGGSPANNIDDAYTRPEAYRLLIGDNPANTFSPDGAMGIVGPDYGGPYPNITRKWAIYYREERAKRPLNIKNIQSTIGVSISGNYSYPSASSVNGNFVHNYEILSTVGMIEQRLMLRDQPSNSSNGATQSPFGNFYDQLPKTTQPITLRHRAPSGSGVFPISSSDLSIPSIISKNIIVNRFSSPGEQNTMSRGFLDVASSEMSSYNSLNYRNLSVRGSGSYGSGSVVRIPQRFPSLGAPLAERTREGLRTLRARHCGTFGQDSQYSSGVTIDENLPLYPSYHKEHRNNLRRKIIDDYIVRKNVQSKTENLNIVFRAVDGNDSLVSNSYSAVAAGLPLSVSFVLGVEASRGATPTHADEPTIIQLRDTSSPFSVKGSNFAVSVQQNNKLTIFMQTRTKAEKEDASKYYNHVYQTKTDPITSSPLWNNTNDRIMHMVVVTWSGIWSQKPVVYVNGEVQELELRVASTALGTDPVSGFAHPFDEVRLFSGGPPRKSIKGSLENVAVWKKFLDSNDVMNLMSYNMDALRIGDGDDLIDYWRLGIPGDPVYASTNNLILQQGFAYPSDISSNDLILEASGTSPNSIISFGTGSYKIYQAIEDNVGRTNNMHYNSLLPASEFQYSWVRACLKQESTGLANGEAQFQTNLENQKIRGFAPPNGLIRVEGQGSRFSQEPAINFLKISEIPCSDNDHTPPCEDLRAYIRVIYPHPQTPGTTLSFDNRFSSSKSFTVKKTPNLITNVMSEITTDQFNKIELKFIDVNGDELNCCEQVYNMRLKGMSLDDATGVIAHKSSYSAYGANSTTLIPFSPPQLVYNNVVPGLQTGFVAGTKSGVSFDGSTFSITAQIFTQCGDELSGSLEIKLQGTSADCPLWRPFNLN